MLRTRRLALVCSLFFVSGASRPSTAAVSAPLAPAVTVDGVDLANSGSFGPDGQQVVKRSVVHALLDPASGTAAWSAGGVRDWKPKTFHYRLAFTAPFEIGTLIAASYRPWTKGQTFRYLKADAAFPGDPERDEDWETIPTKLRTGYDSHIFEPGFKTRAILFSDTRPIHSSKLEKCLLLKKRLLNVTPYTVGQGQMSPGAWYPTDIPNGKEWHGAGIVGEEPRIRRPPVTKLDPSWFIVNRDEGMKPVAMRFVANITNFRLYAYVGEAGKNPALAPDSDWERLAYTVLYETKFGSAGGSNMRLLVMDQPVRSRAFKMLLRETNPPESQVAIIKEWTLWEDLGAAEIPALPPPPPPAPVRVEYDLEVAGETAVAVDFPNGTRARNIMAQRHREVGRNKETWDLKDEYGRYVPVGKYRLHGISAPRLELYYEHTYYPNVENHATDGRPWDSRPQDGWLGNHGNNTGIAVVGDKVFIASSGTEGGHSMLSSTLSGQKIRGWGGGCGRMYSDEKYLYMQKGTTFSRLNPETGRVETSISTTDAERRGNTVGIAAQGGKLYTAFYSPFPYFESPTSMRHVDVDACLPRLPVSIDPPGRDHLLPAAPREDFMRMWRMTGEPAGLGDVGSLSQIPSTDFPGHRQHTVMAFKEPMPVGSLLFPRLMSEEMRLTVSVLKPDAPYPPNPKREADWITFDVPEGERSAWETLAAPPNTMTRAVRVSFIKAGDDGLMTDFDESMREGGEMVGLESTDGEEDEILDGMLKGETWRGELEGIRILRRRLKNVYSSATVHVNSGTINEKTGAWTGQPKEIISRQHPGVYALEWTKKQSLAGLAFREIDGQLTEVDIYTGPDKGAIDFDEPTGKNWQHVTTYRQRGRSGGANSLRSNGQARYLEGFAHFGKERETRAVRLRIIKQWTGGAGRRADFGGGTVDHKRCAVYGVAPLTYIGGEPPSDDLIAQRLAIFDVMTGKVIDEMPSEITGPMAVSDDGKIVAVVGPTVAEIDISGGEAKAVRPYIDDPTLRFPHLMEFDPEGNLYIYDHAWEYRWVHVYDRNGKYTHDIGSKEPYKAGPWNPAIIVDAFDMAVGNHGDIYFQYGYDNPRRTIHFKTDGTYVQEFLGNTFYGGGGTLDRYNHRRALFMDMVFDIDREKRKSHIVALKSTRFGETTIWGKKWRHDMVFRKVNGRKYLVNAPLVIRPVHQMGAVYLWNEETMTQEFVAAMGACTGANFFETPEMIKLLNGVSPVGLSFIFADRNGDREMQPEEVEVFKTPPGGTSLGAFDPDMGIMSKSLRYEIKEFLPDGVPVYHRIPVQEPGGYYRLNTGNYIRNISPLHGQGRLEVVTPEGERVWSYKVMSFDVSGLFIPGWVPGYPANLLCLIGHEVEERGDLGEFFAINSNTGGWNIWTADGLMAGRLTFHTRDPEARGFGAKYDFGTRMDGLTGSQEHFHGFFTKTEDDGRYRIVIGGDHASIVEVRGLDRYKRFNTSFEVTPAMLAKTRAWESERLQKHIYMRSPTVISRRITPVVNAGIGTEEWDSEGDNIGSMATFRSAHNDTTLYLAWTVTRNGPLSNAGDDFRRFFRTGGGVEFMLGSDPTADPQRTEPAAGDLRMLITYVDGKPRVVRYRPVAPDAPAAAAWETRTAVGGLARFDEVVEVDGVQIAQSGGADNFSIEVGIPFSVLGIEPKQGDVFKFDWGVLGSKDGTHTTHRHCWVDTMSIGDADEATEARLHPERWGFIRFEPARKTLLEQLTMDEVEKVKNQDIDDIMDDLEEDF